jgi:sirohydrochlorin cobaltochelatase
MNSNRDSRRALLVVGHGTREPAGVAEMLELTERLARRLPGTIVEPCFLELAEPTIANGVDRCAQRGATEMVVLPLLLFAAGHAKRDIPQAVAEAAARHAGLSVQQTPHLGCHPRVLELSGLRLSEAVGELSAGEAARTLLLMVGRGSYDTSATSEMAAFGRLRFEQRPLGWLEVCFTAMARPSLEEALRVVASMPFERIVIQPHLLFAGELSARVRDSAQQAAIQWPDRQWIAADPLGSHDLLASAIIELSGLETAALAAD